MKILWTGLAWADYLLWQQEDRSILNRINILLADTMRSPFRGLGKPEPLKEELAGWWSRRISQEHRLVYRVRGVGKEQALEIMQCRYHYPRKRR